MRTYSYTISWSMEWVEQTRRRVFHGLCRHCNRNVVQGFDRARCRYLIREHVKQAHR